jgi:hypothetical protein
MATQLTWGGVALSGTDGRFYHLAQRVTKDAALKVWSYPHASGRDYMTMGSQQDSASSVGFVFQEQGGHLNRLVDSTQANIEAKIVAIEALRKSATPVQTLVFYLYTGGFANMRLESFQVGSIEKVIYAGSVEYHAVWSGLFTEFV